ncbi:hypothetical protein MY3296_009637 [Beauveria thailandica]
MDKNYTLSVGVLLVLLSAFLYNSQQGWQRISKLLGTGILILSPQCPGIGVAIDCTTYKCGQNYTVEILSIDPLAIYLNNFLDDAEIRYLLALGENIYRPSEVVSHSGNVVNTTVRSSESAFLPADDVVCKCLISRMKSLLGNVQHEHVESLQMVRYAASGDRYRLHTDWSVAAKNNTDEASGNPRQSRRLGTILVYLEDSCTGGETYFPLLNGVSDSADGDKFAVAKQGQGLLVRPKRGNGVFWNNIHANGTGDDRVVHAGLPIKSGVKVGLNMWSTYYFDAPLVGG